MIMDGINEKLTEEHEDYIQLKTRVDIAVELMTSSTKRVCFGFWGLIRP